MAWTDEKVELLKRMWAEGVTAAEIARALGDVSRNAVIGKAHRLGLSNRAAAPKSAAPKPEEPTELNEDSQKKQEAAKAAAQPAKSSASKASPTKSATQGAAKENAEAEAATPKRSKLTHGSGEPAKKPDAGPNFQELAAALEAEGQLSPNSAEVEEENPIAALAAEAERNARKLTLLELSERTCKWPIGDPSTDDFYFCGLPCAPEKPYCAAHVQVAYQPMSSRRDRERTRARAASA